MYKYLSENIPDARRDGPQLVLFSNVVLEQRVPQDHSIRKINRVVGDSL